ncbi:hypothetical protein BCU94_12175 [Shewanella sp. 10N.286.52.C2]|uniref:hypothetical protein n=1 Tax=unclassified Shewanella TaxID=196818 RepID=UPI000C84640A|nr:MULTISPECIES: hypothetical protein [unclassified Shewanella]MDO6678130.1 hypothetical protein [Shewanella sp. 4_MG-2023]PMG30342.1 hypothetical protein BCU94_12175 [Shewanella sp. 10N.286.52.C2]
MLKTNLSTDHFIQVALIALITLLLLLIIYPAWTVANARLALKTDKESGATLAERYLILGDWPSGNEDMLLTHFKDFQINIDSTANHSSLSNMSASQFSQIQAQSKMQHQTKHDVQGLHQNKNEALD